MTEQVGGRRVLNAAVFGGSGFIGRAFIHRLAPTGAGIRVVGRNPVAAGHLRTAGRVGQIVPVAARLSDERAIAAALSGCDTVVNLVGILYETSRQRFAEIHGAFPGRLARAAEAAGVTRFVQVSAIGADPDSASAYARSKAEGEAALRAALPGAVILRPSVVFGPDDGFLNRFGAMAVWSPALPLIGGGRTRFQPVYVGDVAAALLAAVTRDDVAGRTFELAGPRTYSFRELMQLIVSETGRKRALIDLPWNLASAQARFFELLPGAPMLTRDQVTLLRRDNVAAPGAPGLAELGIVPTPLEVIAPTYLGAYRAGGRFGRARAA